MKLKRLPAAPLIALLVTTVIPRSGIAEDDDAKDVDFNRDIRPLLAANCFACHGRDDDAREAGLRLDQREAAIEWGAIVPGRPGESELIARVFSTDPDLVMPPADSGHELSSEEKQLLKDWVADGAEYRTHWSFTAPAKAEFPEVRQDDWPRQPLDWFVLARLEENQLAPAPDADRYRWIRRVSLDLTGLPPTPEEADAFAADRSEDAYERVVDRLLESEAYGERWARMWLDLARYADTKGYEKDRPREIWKYRDWVINALNSDMPFDQFTREQLAGDLLSDPTTDQLIATAFHRNTMTNDEGGTDNEEFRVAAVKDRVDTTVQVWMGLTMGCAKCHSHKYDPITNREYYSFYAFFNQTQDADRSNDAPVLPLPTAEQKQEISRLQSEIKSARRELTGLSDRSEDRAESETQSEAATGSKASADSDTQGTPAPDAPAPDAPAPDNAAEAETPKTARNAQHAKSLKKKIDSLQKQLQSVQNRVVKLPVMRQLPENKRRPTRMHRRGNFLDKGEPVEPGVPEVFGSWPQDAPQNRLGVARWLTQPDNPLTARVMVNRIWARLFGTGLVETEEDFGTQGTPPSHPQLLDWLAVDFRENGWSLKKLIRSIVLSSAYRQSSAVSEEKLATDPNNRLLSRGPRFRLAAEIIRDQALAASGLLTRKVGGPSVMPPQPDGIWKSTYSGLKWNDATGPNRYRRALYTYWKRTSPYPAMLTFDAGTGEVCQIRRVRTNTPLQALVTLNDPAYVEAAGALARRMQKSGEDEDTAARIRRGFRLVLIRKPDRHELIRLLELYESLSDDFADNPQTASALLKSAGVTSGDGDAAMVAVANVLLNLDETLMKP